MERSATICMTVLTALSLTVPMVSADPGRGWSGSGGGGMDGICRRTYDPATVETVSGTIESINRTVPRKGMKRGVHLTLKTENGPISVRLGPEWYLDRMDVNLAKGDLLEVKGSRVAVAGNPAIIAAEVKKGEAVLALRGENGVPAWAGQRR